MQNNIKEIRKIKKISQDALAKKIGISRPALSAIENGTIPNGDTMLKIAQVLSIKTEKIFFIDDVVLKQQNDLHKQ
jgi:putative transcriptional regulator